MSSSDTRPRDSTKPGVLWHLPMAAANSRHVPDISLQRLGTLVPNNIGLSFCFFLNRCVSATHHALLLRQI